MRMNTTPWRSCRSTNRACKKGGNWTEDGDTSLTTIKGYSPPLMIGREIKELEILSRNVGRSPNDVCFKPKGMRNWVEK